MCLHEEDRSHWSNEWNAAREETRRDETYSKWNEIKGNKRINSIHSPEVLRRFHVLILLLLPNNRLQYGNSKLFFCVWLARVDWLSILFGWSWMGGGHDLDSHIDLLTYLLIFDDHCLGCNTMGSWILAYIHPQYIQDIKQARAPVQVTTARHVDPHHVRRILTFCKWSILIQRRTREETKMKNIFDLGWLDFDRWWREVCG